jgi:uncharacterized protein YegL
MGDTNLPGGAIAKRALHFILMLDCSGSMALNGKMQSLNHAIQEAVPHMKTTALANPNAELMIRSIRFSSGASWHQSRETPVESYKWTALQSDGGSTDMAGAVKLATDALKQLPGGRQFPPVLCLVSDGMPDSVGEFEKRLAELKADPWGARAVRVAIGIGDEATGPAGLKVLQSFVGNVELPVLAANNAQDLVNMIRFVSTVVTESASKPPSQTQAGSLQASAPSNVPLAAPPPASTPSDPNLPW